MIIVHVVHRLPYECNGINVVLDNLAKQQQQKGANVTVLNVATGSLSDNVRRVHSLVKSAKPDIVVFHSLYRLAFFRLAKLLKHYSIPYLIMPHGGTSYSNAQKGWLKKKIANYLFANRFVKNAAAIIYLNKNEMNDCVFSKLRKSTTIIPNGINHPIETSHIKENDNIRFIYVASIRINHKGLDLLLDAINGLAGRNQLNNMEFHFYGSPESEEDKKIFREKLDRVSSYCQFHGSVKGNDKEMAYRKGDVFVLTSRYEGMPMSVLEALSYGIPCLLTRQTNMGEFVANNNCGWIVNLSADSIADGILAAAQAFKNSEGTLRLNAINAVKDYSWDSIAELSLREYNRFTNHMDEITFKND